MPVTVMGKTVKHDVDENYLRQAVIFALPSFLPCFIKFFDQNFHFHL